MLPDDYARGTLQSLEQAKTQSHMFCTALEQLDKLGRITSSDVQALRDIVKSHREYLLELDRLEGHVRAVCQRHEHKAGVKPVHMVEPLRLQALSSYFEMAENLNRYISAGGPETGFLVHYLAATVFETAEGFRDKLKLTDPDVDKLLEDPQYQLLRHFRHTVFHFNPDPMAPKHTNFILKGTIYYLKQLMQALRGFFCKNVRTRTVTDFIFHTLLLRGDQDKSLSEEVLAQVLQVDKSSLDRSRPLSSEEWNKADKLFDESYFKGRNRKDIIRIMLESLQRAYDLDGVLKSASDELRKRGHSGPTEKPEQV
jgi:hypothetical protein